MAKKKAPKFEELREEYARLFEEMRLSPAKLEAISGVATRILKNKAKYQEVEKKTGAPWFFIGALHYRESNLNFKKHLHNGDSLLKRTRRVPANRPLKGNPPFTWEESAIDALRMKGLYAIRTWSIEQLCYQAERYNGFGYRWNKAGLSPYVWSATTHYVRGKYVEDGKLDRSHVDSQLGVMPIIFRLAELDSSIELTSALKPASKTVLRSKSLLSLVGGAITWLGTQVTDAFQSSWDALAAGVAMVPALVAGSEEQVQSTQTLAEWLQVDWSSVGKYVILAIIVVVFFRELDRKRAT